MPRPEKREYVVVIISSGEEAIVEYDDGSLATYQKDAIIRTGLINLKRYAPASKPESVECAIYKLGIKQGKIERTYVSTLLAQVPSLPLTLDEFMVEAANAISGLPAEFKEYAANLANSLGNDDGYESKLNCLTEIVEHLGPTITKFLANRSNT